MHWYVDLKHPMPRADGITRALSNHASHRFMHDSLMSHVSGKTQPPRTNTGASNPSATPRPTHCSCTNGSAGHKPWRN
ncbi:hypothetical protein BCR44DRAFT_1432782 [Catenaria anguillulae PL171]|uniref:Uncharacterized protein n=1 Tax=Catenaria anguillulae PL171 TaxID=765915 RepID=A0A1Y2HNC0_9FUNG|nr:hypothetical protein BCR44DRAFT_1432782 [Catenaria anguillulae PL171]